MKKIMFYTSTGGGPLTWGKQLAEQLKKNKLKYKHIFNKIGLLFSPIDPRGNIIHSTIPIPLNPWRKKYILTIHGEYTIESKRYRWLYKQAIKKADIITTPSEFLKQRLQLTKAIIIPNGINMKEFIPKRIEGKKIKLITVMNFHHPNKCKGIIKISKILHNSKIENYEYIIVGDGKYRKEIEQKVKKYNLNIKFLGRKNNIPKLLSKQTIFLYYSEHDNFPIAILEAMAAQIPVITNNIGAVNEMIESPKEGIIAQNDKEYAVQLKKLIKDKKKQKEITKNAHKKVEKKFNWDKLIKEYIKLYGVNK